METIWIIGVGQFGRLAFQRLSAGRLERNFVLVDPDEGNLERAGGQAARYAQDGVDFVWRALAAGPPPDWIVPALPVHLAAEWCLKRLGPKRLRRIDVPEDAAAAMPHPLRGATGDIYVSHATFTCPDDCAEPAGHCTVTRQPRPRNMFEVLGELQVPSFRTLVVRSRQLGPGIGGYRPRQLEALIEQVAAASCDLLVCTACRCHGVVTGMRPGAD